MQAAILLLVACAFNFLVWASPTAVMEPAVAEGVKQYPPEESHHSLETTWVGHVHQPRELGKRWITESDRRVLVINIGATVARSLGIANTYNFVFQYHYDGGINQIVYDYDHTRFGMSWPQPLLVGLFDNGCDIAIPAIVTAAASGVDTLLCTFIWGARLRTDWVTTVGMGLFELSVISGAGVHLRIAPFMYSWQFNQLPW